MSIFQKELHTPLKIPNTIFTIACGLCLALAYFVGSESEN